MPVKSLSLFWVGVKAWKGTEGEHAGAATAGGDGKAIEAQARGLSGGVRS